MSMIPTILPGWARPWTPSSRGDRRAGEAGNAHTRAPRCVAHTCRGKNITAFMLHYLSGPDEAILWLFTFSEKDLRNASVV